MCAGIEHHLVVVEQLFPNFVLCVLFSSKYALWTHSQIKQKCEEATKKKKLP